MIAQCREQYWVLMVSRCNFLLALADQALPGIPVSITFQDVPFPNRLIQANPSLQVKLLNCTELDLQNSPIMDIRRVLEISLKDTSMLRKANKGNFRIPSKTERISIRRMMSRYWDNSSIFSMDLVGAVVRQGSFIAKMHSIDWVHCPTLAGTMERLIIKYSRYFDILEKYPSQVAVPTLDVDLAW